jgi:hypothetical protein
VWGAGKSSGRRSESTGDYFYGVGAGVKFEWCCHISRTFCKPLWSTIFQNEIQTKMGLSSLFMLILHFCDAWDQTQGFEHVRQELCHWAILLIAPFLFSQACSLFCWYFENIATKWSWFS